MPKFNDREDYERWKAERVKQLSERAFSSDGGGEKGSGGPSAPEIERPSPENSGSLSGIGELFGRTWQVYKRRFWTLIALSLLMIVLFVLPLAALGGGGYALSLALPEMKTILIGVFLSIGIVISFITLFWGISGLLYAVADDTLSVGEALGRGWPKAWGLAWLLSVLGFLTTGGYLLFFLPGVLFTVWFSFGQFIFIEEDERGMRALLKSKEFVRGYGLAVFMRLVLVWLISGALGIIPVVGAVLSFLFVPYPLIFSFLLYRELKTIKGDISFSSSTGEKVKWLGTATLGYILVPVVIVALFGASLLSLVYLFKVMLLSRGLRAV